MVHWSSLDWARRAFLGMLLCVSLNIPAHGQALPRETAPQPPRPGPTSLFAKATEIDVRLITALSAFTARQDDRVEVVTIRPMVTDRGVAIPTGSILTGIVSGVRSPTELSVGFNRFVVKGELYFVSGSVTKVFDSRGSVIAEVRASSFGELTSTSGLLELPTGTLFRVRLR
jgi:hypothetical protein